MKKLKKIVSIIMLCVMTLGTCFISTGCSNSNNGLHKDSSLSQTKSGGGGVTPSPDNIDNNYPQPEPRPEPSVEGPIIPDEEKTNWNDIFVEYAQQSILVNSNDPEYRNLPAGYTQVRSIASSGTQYIDTGVNGGNAKKIILKTAIVDKLTTNQTFWCSRQNLTQNTSWTCFNIGGKFRFDYYSVNTTISTKYIELNKIYEIKADNNKFYVDNELLLTHSESSFNSVGDIWLMASYNPTEGSGISNYAYMRLYSCKIYDGETLVRDFVPCFDLNKEFGLYDVVNDVFYTNQGSGSFNSNYNYAIQGSGTQADPYQISSAMDLAYFSYNKGKASGKYLKLMDDIELNDGTFEVDENYNIIYHDGGDGKLYEWTPIQNANSGAFLDGNGHSIKGLYINDASVEYGGLFYENNSSNNLQHVGFKDLTIEDVYIHATYAYSLCHSIRDHMTNVIVKSGYLIGEKKANGFCFYRIYSGMENCENHANIVKVGSASGPNFDGSSGFSKDFIGKVVNCRNYGNIHLVANGGLCGGLFANMVYGKDCENCENHGNITGKCDRAGGYSSSPGGTTAPHITNFTNYGNINAGSGAGVFVAIPDVTVIVENCKNFGKINGSGLIGFGEGRPFSLTLRNCTNYGEVTASGIIGSFTSAKANVLIENCVNKGPVRTAGILGQIYRDNGNINCTVVDCRNEGRVAGGRYTGGIVGFCYGSKNYVTVKNCVNTGKIASGDYFSGGIVGGFYQTDNKLIIDRCVNKGEVNSTAGIFGTNNENNVSPDNVKITNCINEGKVTGASAISGGPAIVINCLNKGEITRNNAKEIAPASAIIKNCVSDCLYKGERKRSYWGTDFSAFFLTWKDRRIGLIAIESVGLYRGKLTEKYLYENDFNAVDHIYEVTEEEKENKFKSTYTQLEYLESTGTQWIDTGVIPTSTMKFVLQSNFSTGAMGASVASNSKTIFDFRSQGKIRYGEKLEYDYVKLNQKQTFIIDYLNSKTSCDENENIFSATPNFGNATFTIFTWHEGSGYYYYTSGKFYELEIYNGGILIRDYIPAQRKSDNVFGLYDKVSGQFYTNQGTGTFLGG